MFTQSESGSKGLLFLVKIRLCLWLTAAVASYMHHYIRGSYASVVLPVIVSLHRPFEVQRAAASNKGQLNSQPRLLASILRDRDEPWSNHVNWGFWARGFILIGEKIA